MEKDRVLRLLEAADWKDIILKLTHYALQRQESTRGNREELTNS